MTGYRYIACYVQLCECLSIENWYSSWIGFDVGMKQANALKYWMMMIYITEKYVAVRSYKNADLNNYDNVKRKWESVLTFDACDKSNMTQTINHMNFWLIRRSNFPLSSSKMFQALKHSNLNISSIYIIYSIYRMKLLPERITIGFIRNLLQQLLWWKLFINCCCLMIQQPDFGSEIFSIFGFSKQLCQVLCDIGCDSLKKLTHFVIRFIEIYSRFYFNKIEFFISGITN